jgi:hypothetical protein
MPAEYSHFTSRSICEVQNANFNSSPIMAADGAIRSIGPGPSDAVCGPLVTDYLAGLFQHLSGST